MGAAVPDRRLIAIEGLPGSGHSEFARWVGNRPDWHAVCGTSSAIGPSQRGGRMSVLSVLLQQMLERYELSSSLAEADLFHGRTVTDFTFDTHMLWAQSLLPDSEWNLYQKIAAAIPVPTVQPDLVVFLQAPEQELVASLRNTDRAVEPDRWRDLVASYQRHFFAYDRTPLLVVRIGAAHSVADDDAREALWRRIAAFPGGKTYLGGEVDAWLGGSPSAP